MQIDDVIQCERNKKHKTNYKTCKRLTQATLIATKWRRYPPTALEDEKLHTSLANSKGIGTPATRDGIIHDLIARGYIVDKKIITWAKSYIETLKKPYIIAFAAKL